MLIWAAVCAVGGGLAIAAAGRTWAAVTFPARPGGRGATEVPLTGNDLVPSLTPVLLAALAAVLAVLASRGAGRRAIGALIALFGVVTVVACWYGTRTPAIVSAAREHAAAAVPPSGGVAAHTVTWAWPSAAVAGGLVLLAAGAVAAVRGARWPGMSSRYDRPGGERAAAGARRARPGGERALWDAIDEGIDPTVDGGAADDGEGSTR